MEAWSSLAEQREKAGKKGGMMAKEGKRLVRLQRGGGGEGAGDTGK